MKISKDRILTTHAGSLPRPDDLRRMLLDRAGDKSVDEAVMKARVGEAVAEAVERQRSVGIDVISDGEMGKIGFSSYVLQHYTGFEESASFMAADLGDFPELAMKLFASGANVRLPVLNGPIEPRDPQWVQEEIGDFARVLDGVDRDDAFICAVTPGHIAFNFPNRYYPSHAAYIEAAADALQHEYKAIVEAGFNLQLDSPDCAMAWHCSVEGSDLRERRAHTERNIAVLNEILADLPTERLRFHVCWGNYNGPHHRDVGLKDILDLIVRTRAKFLYVEAANPQHEHEWEVWKEARLPDDKILIVGVIDPKTNHVEHPLTVAQRIQRFADVVGRERVVAGTDCGFETFAGMLACDPAVAWKKLEMLTEGARAASENLW
ncbi:MAG: epoxyalkane--coenzyme M transferase [Streptosporangiales bacterium]|nr:epoxyalkane--coenzyme M transferase [Streptosporangiales bacterium]